MSLAASMLWFAADVGIGRLRGSSCPNCDAAPGRSSRLYAGRFHAFSVYRCHECAVLYRPVGIRGKWLDLYYSRLYANADLATDLERAGDPAGISARMAAEGKHRVALVEGVLGERASPPSLCIVGCSWGYELLPFRERGYDVFGIEVGSVRREHGKRKLGLSIYATPEEAAAERGRVDVALSSHMLEHVPRVTDLVKAITYRLAPSVQVHITPYVDSVETDPSLARIIGREHPLGITAEFWRRFAANNGQHLDCRVDAYEPGRACGELVAVLRAPTAPPRPPITRAA
ncbi:MAG TPA: methyltransferase domain-containing protein [Polyangiaceae bacterium]|nr:methyltransferase domain-containing protein [Polyangiaceae bacterium]